jgi:hypothetical protein
VSEGEVTESGIFHKILRIDSSRLAEFFARDVLGNPVILSLSGRRVLDECRCFSAFPPLAGQPSPVICSI